MARQMRTLSGVMKHPIPRLRISRITCRSIQTERQFQSPSNSQYHSYNPTEQYSLDSERIGYAVLVNKFLGALQQLDEAINNQSLSAASMTAVYELDLIEELESYFNRS